VCWQQEGSFYYPQQSNANSQYRPLFSNPFPDVGPGRSELQSYAPFAQTVGHQLGKVLQFKGRTSTCGYCASSSSAVVVNMGILPGA
jgi:hypothetical protein